VKARLKSGLADAEERLRATVRARLLAARSEISAETRRDPGEVGALAARLLTRSATRLDGGGQAADELGARIETWMDEVRARTDAAERRLDETGARARGRLEEYVDVSLSRKERRHELRLARAEREERIAEAEARVEVRGEEMLRQIRVDVDRVRADATATVRTEVAAALERLNELFESETEVLRIGIEGELERMLRAAREQLTSRA
jgi:site-specific recombinase